MLDSICLTLDTTAVPSNGTILQLVLGEKAVCLSQEEGKWNEEKDCFSKLFFPLSSFEVVNHMWWAERRRSRVVRVARLWCRKSS